MVMFVTPPLSCIYFVIEEDYFEESDIFPDGFIKQCKDNENEAQFVPLEVKK